MKILSFFFSVIILLLQPMLYSRPMVYDCFIFLNELELLDIRLHEMADVVDKFLLVESVETFRGNPKPLNFAANRCLFEEFADKIIYVVANERLNTTDPWQREFFQRNQIMQGLIGCNDDDIILISDVDEIIEHTGVTIMCDALKMGSCKYAGATHRFHANFLNSMFFEYTRGAVATTYRNVKESMPQGLRNIKDSVPCLAKGWHFSWQGGPERDLYKLGAYSHQETDTPEERERKGRNDRYLCPVMEIDDSFPQYIRENQDYFESIGFIKKPTSNEVSNNANGQ